jgi:mycothiol synthase
MVELRTADGLADLERYARVWNAITPDEPVSAAELLARRERDPRRLQLLAVRAGEVVGCGYAGPSQSEGRGFLSPRVLPAARRAGVGTVLLERLAGRLHELGFAWASAFVDGGDAGSLAFAERHGFGEVDRQVEQVKPVGAEPSALVPRGVRFVTVARQPGLLRRAHELARQGFEDVATPYPVTVALADWLAEEATEPEGSFVALAGDEVVGYTGLCRRADGGVEDGLTVVRRDWRRRGLALALERAKLAWAAANGIHEIVTWTQAGNEGMRALNELLGYEYRSVAITVRAPLPLPRP